MRIFVYLFLVMSFSPICNAQNATITIGRGTDCFGRGACSITIENSNEFNATFFKNHNGTTILRIYRDKLSKENEDRIFGNPITEFNMNSLNFQMEEEIPIHNTIEPSTSSTWPKELNRLKTGIYPTVITMNYIDVQVLNE
ncbi:MAG: hypothetical protein AAF489_13010 [Bacteroidota bacterium]